MTTWIARSGKRKNNWQIKIKSNVQIWLDSYSKTQYKLKNYGSNSQIYIIEWTNSYSKTNYAIPIPSIWNHRNKMSYITKLKRPQTRIIRSTEYNKIKMKVKYINYFVIYITNLNNLNLK